MDRIGPNGENRTGWIEQEQGGSNRTEVVEWTEHDQIGQNRTKVDRIGPKWTEQNQSEPNGLNRTEMIKVD